jgi:hypothetical protein
MNADDAQKGVDVTSIVATADPADAEANVDETNGIKTEDGAENEAGGHQAWSSSRVLGSKAWGTALDWAWFFLESGVTLWFHEGFAR